MTASLQQNRPIHGKGVKKSRTPGIIFVIVFHIVGIWALSSGLANKTIELLKGPVEAVVTTEEVKEDTPPPPPPPDFKPPPVVAIAPEVSIDLAAAPPPAATTAITNTPPKPPAPVAVAPPPPPPPPTAVVCIPADCNRAHAVTAEDYPPVSQRLQEQGVVSIRYVVSATGAVSDCAVTTSSGKPRLDDAACKMVMRRWKFKPATQDGKPVQVQLPALVTFQLK
jgi:periplasmic protein TonB